MSVKVPFFSDMHFCSMYNYVHLVHELAVINIRTTITSEQAFDHIEDWYVCDEQTTEWRLLLTEYRQRSPCRSHRRCRCCSRSQSPLAACSGPWSRSPFLMVKHLFFYSTSFIIYMESYQAKEAQLNHLKSVKKMQMKHDLYARMYIITHYFSAG